MISKYNKPDIKLTVQSGGCLEFEKTGIMPRFLVFNSQELRRTWRLILKDDKQNGVLKINRKIVLHYFFDDLGCRMQNVTDGAVGEKWEIEEILIEMRD